MFRILLFFVIPALLVAPLAQAENGSLEFNDSRVLNDFRRFYDNRKLDGVQQLKWDEATWSCPSSVDTKGQTHLLSSSTVYSGPPEEIRSLKPFPLKGGTGHYWYEGDNTYLLCQYEGLDIEIMVHAEGAKFCAETRKPVREACWK